MAFIYVTEQGAYIRKKGSHVEVVKDGEILSECAVREAKCLVTFGGVQVTTDAMLALLDAGCDIAFMTVNGHFKGRVVSALGKNSVLRAAQYQAFCDPARRLAFARRYVAAKIRNGMDVLHDYHRSGRSGFMFEHREQLEELAGKALAAESLESLRGYEGAAARLYFEGFGKCLLHGRQWPGRVFHPSTDPVNALLSFGYSFIAREIQAMLDALGMDPYIGFFHDITYGRASLSLDLMEEFRHPLVDRLVLRLFNRQIVDDGDFERRGADDPQLYLRKESLKLFIRHYEEWASSVNRTWNDEGEMSWRQAIWSQGEKLREAIESGGDYTPFSWKRACESAPAHHEGQATP